MLQNKEVISMKLTGFKKVCAIAFATILAACSATGGAGNAYDGVWSGLITLNIGDETCMRRENFIVKIEHGYMTGKTRTIKYKTKITGGIDENGDVEYGEFDLGTVARDAVMTGKFEGKEAAGEWQSKRCKGKWTLRRIQ
ncbi:hypothetical protein [Curvivirga sp.]|uniref:hypothetical protein n=1 Tax=Curvivirga sp. TaxID=2856848 RepID=UPI003B5BA31C